ncbi:unnamed protein product [Arabis nemorensis]|uniref:Uncharacterized protein n=1 Tax=Arabis nemorensis TaxID=586526 RepID=A0A565C5U3_9BRAS|nr:unnamed protein product [Arabis nemorensis]
MFQNIDPMLLVFLLMHLHLLVLRCVLVPCVLIAEGLGMKNVHAINFIGFLVILVGVAVEDEAVDKDTILAGGEELVLGAPMSLKPILDQPHLSHIPSRVQIVKA